MYTVLTLLYMYRWHHALKQFHPSRIFVQQMLYFQYKISGYRYANLEL